MKSKIKNLRSLLLELSLPIASDEIPNFRGAFVKFAGIEKDFLHNHNGVKGYHYRYPLVQYRIRNRKAAILALDKGIEDVQKALFENSWELNWKGKSTAFQVDLEMKEYSLELSDTYYKYRLYRWVGLNDENYHKWQGTTLLVDKIKILEKALTGHILAFASGVNWQIPGRFEVELCDLKRSGRCYLHGTRMINFDIVFRTNLLLPPLVGLGNGAAMGFGWNIPLHSKINKTNSRKLSPQMVNGSTDPGISNIGFEKIDEQP